MHLSTYHIFSPPPSPLSVYLSACLFSYLTINLSLSISHLHLQLSLNLSTCLIAHQHISLLISPFFTPYCLSVCLSTRLSPHAPVYICFTLPPSPAASRQRVLPQQNLLHQSASHRQQVLLQVGASCRFRRLCAHRRQPDGAGARADRVPAAGEGRRPSVGVGQVCWKPDGGEDMERCYLI